jgi:hypothetical protein
VVELRDVAPTIEASVAGHSTPSWRKVIIEALAAVAVAIALVCALMWHVVAHLGSRFVGGIGSDAAGGIWWLWHVDRVGYHVFGTTRDPFVAAPFGVEQSNWINLQSLVPYYPAVLATKVVNEVAAFNLVVILGLALSGAAMYALVRYLGASCLVAAWAGMVYIVFPAHLVHVEHGSLTHFEVLALTMLAVAAAADRPTSARLALVAGATILSWATFGYFGAMAFVGATSFAVGAAVVARGSRGRLQLAVGTTAAALAATAAFGLLAVGTGGDTGGSLARDVADLSKFGLRPTELVIPPEQSLLFGDALATYHSTRRHGSLLTETSNYLGLLTLVLAAGWLVVAWRRRRSLSERSRRATVGLSAVAIVSLLLALPSPVGVLGHLWSWTPARLLYEFLPAFRVPSRWVALLMTALVPLGALGLEGIRRAVAARAGAAHAAAAGAAVVTAAIMVSATDLLIWPLGEITRADAAPPEYAAVGRVDADIVAEYPLRRSTLGEFWQRRFDRPLLNGARDGTYAASVTRSLIAPDARGTPEQLALLGVGAILTRPDALDAVNGEPRDVPGANWGRGYALVERFGDGSSLWRVTASPAPALVSYSGSFGLPHVLPDGSVGHRFVGPSGTLELASRTDQLVRIAFDAAPGDAPATLRVGGRTYRIAARTRVSLRVRVPSGRSRLALRLDGGPAPVEMSAPWSERASGPLDVTATRITSDPGF